MSDETSSNIQTRTEEANAQDTVASTDQADANVNQAQKWRFYAMFISLCVTSLLSALDTIIVSTVLPSIVADLDSKNLYVWALNSFFLSMTTAQPLYGQTANIFGRRWLVIIAIGFFASGSGICGGANSTAMFVAGHVIKGVGGGGINVMIDMVVCVVVPQRERGKYMGFVFAIYSIGATLGPLLGGVFAQSPTWRWAFYINLPIVAVALPLIVIFLGVSYDRETHMLRKLARIDYVGNAFWPPQLLGVGLMIIGFGSLTLLDKGSPNAIQAPLSEEYVATATGTWGFLRSYCSIWGISIPSAIVNSRVKRMLHIAVDQTVRDTLANGAAYEHSTAKYIKSIGDPVVKASVIEVYTSDLKLVWQVSIGFSMLGLVFALLVKEIPMLQHLETTEFGY